MTQPRLHHLVPAFYLAGFTVKGTADDSLHVFDYVRNRRYASSPRKAGRQRDYFRVNEPSVDPYVLERELGKIEGEYALILKEIRPGNRLFKPEHRTKVLELAALIHAKTSRSRQQLARGLAVSLHRKLLSGEVTEEQWEALRQAELRAGTDPARVPPFEEVRDLVVRGNWNPVAPQILQVGMVGDVFGMVRRVLLARSWELMRTNPTNSGGFITSDSPLTWGTIPRSGTTFSGDRMDDADAEVTFPLSHSAALVSYRKARSGNYDATDDIVAHVNARTLFLSSGSIYFGRQPFLLERETGIGSSDAYFTYVEEARQRGILRP